MTERERLEVLFRAAAAALERLANAPDPPDARLRADIVALRDESVAALVDLADRS